MDNFNIMTDLIWPAAAVYCLFLGLQGLLAVYFRKAQLKFTWNELRTSPAKDETESPDNPYPRPLLLLVYGVILSLSGLWLGFVWLFI